MMSSVSVHYECYRLPVHLFLLFNGRDRISPKGQSKHPWFDELWKGVGGGDGADPNQATASQSHSEDSVVTRSARHKKLE
mgnify:CR=1 FL=1